MVAFGHSLRECSARLRDQDLDETDLATVVGFAERILGQPMEPNAGVEGTLAELWRRHDLVLFTKGQDEEQRLEIERSGLASRFRHRFVVPEKGTSVYRAVLGQLSSQPTST